MFWGPAHILFAQCIPAGSLFMSIFLLIRVRLPPVTHSLLLWVKEPTCDAGLCVTVCVKKKVWGLRSRASLPSINMAKWFPHMVKYLCNVILLAVELRTSGCDLHPRWLYLLTHTHPHKVWMRRGGLLCASLLCQLCVCVPSILGISVAFKKNKASEFKQQWAPRTHLQEAEVILAWFSGFVGRRIG